MASTSISGDSSDSIDRLRSLGVSIHVDADGNAVSARWGVHSPITEDGLELLRQLATLKELELTGMTDTRLQYLASMSQLTRLSLGRHGFSRITDAGLEYLSQLTNLRALVLLSTKVTDSGMIHLQGLQALQSLDVTSTNVTLEGLRQLEGLTNLRNVAAPENVSLEYVALFPGLEIVFSSGTTDEEAAMLTNLGRLKELGIESTQITDDAIRHLLQLQTLQQLYLFETQITPEGFTRLQAELPHCNVET